MSRRKSRVKRGSEQCRKNQKSKEERGSDVPKNESETEAKRKEVNSIQGGG